MKFCFTLPVIGRAVFRYRYSADFHMSHLSRNEVWGEQRRSGVHEGEARAWEVARATLPGILAERSHSDPPQLRSGG